MFPLGSVLFPGALLPLHVFEARYRRLVQDCLAGEPEFGVVLIDRGHEVGGGDVRREVGTVARILEVRELPDGRCPQARVLTRRRHQANHGQGDLHRSVGSSLHWKPGTRYQIVFEAIPLESGRSFIRVLP